MAPTTLLYGWATPAVVVGSPVDHTWVTSYDNNADLHPNLAAVVAAKEDYWFCWGSFHHQGRALGSKAGNLILARCLVQSNADSLTTFPARGTIFTYGVDGVCHQLANQVLYATGINGARLLTVANANGYRVSSAIYGTYGLQHAAWRNKIAACGAATVPGPPPRRQARPRPHQPPGPGPNMSATAPDEFEERVGQVLGVGGLSLASQLLNLRAQFQAAAAAQAHAMVIPTASELNARNQRFLDDAAKLLSKTDFKAIFEVEPSERVDLVLDNPVK